jgi:hypothetical protein
MHVELVRPPDTVGDRAAAVVGAGWQVTTWEPCPMRPDRIPRTLGPCDGLVIGEGDGGAVPVASAGTSVVPLRRYPRPSQGSISGEATNGLLLVLISPRTPSGAQALRDWGDFVHLRHIAEAGVPGYRTISSWEHEAAGEPRFCHLYEMHTDDPTAAFLQMTDLVRERVGAAFDEWAWHRELRIDESRTYRRTG